MRILYIGGAGRSGSTLIELILGNMPGFFSVGEVRYFWEYVLENKYSCGCGESISSCTYWSTVMGELANQDDIDIEKVAAIAQDIDRTRNLLRQAFPKSLPTREFSNLVTATEKLYEAIALHINDAIIVDSSKVPSHLFVLLNFKQVDLRVIHLVRDPRAVVYSWRKRKKKELADLSGEAYMDQRSVGQSLVRWGIENQYTEWFGRRAGRYTLLRYEDFVKYPYAQLSTALSKVGLAEYPPQILKSTELSLNPTHSIGGNPIRFSSQKIRIVPDETWRKGLNPLTQTLISVVGLPWMIKYHYLNSQA